MMVARWSIDARFGYKAEVVDALQRWMREIGSQIGWKAENVRILTGSVGTREATVQAEILIRDLAELNAAWDRLATLDTHKQWSQDLEPFVVSGSPRWEVLRVVG
ncbi:hypothetical protein [Thauera aromatica]|uniref:Uncharacterized protein n=1 Tax=Thauera aromatica K172 TaxID=44139 RepID=A0A2R4BR44_THAAR|nr:hypothetical protein [Thauera aromatica]AVR89750.1 hypothetical protein Tharo_2868 [Thauera aromatica K172]MCK2096008.1 hypothetical protein [Thauera aromatica]